MAIRRVLLELEARLEPSGRGKAKGKLEFKRYADGRQRMKIKCKGLEVAEGARLELRRGETVVGLLEARRGRAELDEERAESHEAPPFAAGDRLVLCHDGVPLLTGEVTLD